MWCTMVCLSFVTSLSLAGDPLLESLHGVHGLNEVAVCAGRARCGGALLRERWLATRRSCVLGARRLSVPGARISDRCENLVIGFEMYIKSIALGTNTNSARRVSFRSAHPTVDLSLLQVDRPFFYVEPLANTTAVDLVFQQIGLLKWMNGVIDGYSAAENAHGVPLMVKLKSKPVLLFIVTMALPLGILILVSFYVIFGTRPPSEVQRGSLSVC